MWHHIKSVAEERNLSPRKLVDFALANQEKYGVFHNIGEVLVNTFHVDKLISDFVEQKDIIVSEIDNDNFKLVVMKKCNGKFDVIVDGVVRHPECDNEAVIRALAHYLNSFSYKLSKTEKAQ